MPRQSLTPGEPLTHISLAFRPTQLSTLRRWARQDEASVSTLVRRAVDDYIARRLSIPEREAVAV